MRNSFSLIEIIIVTSIMAIFTGFMIANYQSYPEKKRHEAEVQRLIDILELAKKKASAADLSPGCTGSFYGYRVVVAPSMFQLFIHCDVDTLVQRYPFSSSFIISKGNTTIDFKPLSAGAALSGSTITIKHQTLGSCIDIAVSQTGVIDASRPYSSGC